MNEETRGERLQLLQTRSFRMRDPSVLELRSQTGDAAQVLLAHWKYGENTK